MKVVFFTLFKEDLASSKVRVGLYLPLCSANGVKHRVISYLSQGEYTGLRTKKTSSYKVMLHKIFAIFQLLIEVPFANVVVIQKVLLHKRIVDILVRINNKIVFDYDDALFALPTDGMYPAEKLSSDVEKLNKILSLSSVVIAGNSYLRDYALKYNPNTIVLPSPVDTSLFKPASVNKKREVPVIGWTGAGEQHLKHLLLIKDALDILGKNHKFIFQIIGTLGSEKMKAVFSNSSYPVEFIDWLDMKDMPTYITNFDVGIMPLIDDEWSRGKCGYKALLYLSCGVPAICSPVGINKDIIIQGENGFLASSSSSWVNHLSDLLRSDHLREHMSQRAREIVEREYSVKVLSKVFFDILNDTANPLIER